MIARDIDYEFPDAAFFILAVLIWLALCLALAAYRQGRLEMLAPQRLLNAILSPRSNFYTWIKASSLILAWVFACLALMGPKGHARYIHSGERVQQAAQQEPPRTILILVDASASMGIRDTRLKISRLEDAKAVGDALISQMGSSANTAVFAFTSVLTQLSPPTPDQLFTRLMLKNIPINEGDAAGTDYLAVFKALHALFLSRPSDMQYTLILLSDGGDTNVEGLEGASRDAAVQKILEQLAPSPGVNFRILTVGVGSQEGGKVPDLLYQGHAVQSSLNSQLLQQISAAGHGKSYLSNDYTPLVLAHELAKEIKQASSTSAIFAPSSSAKGAGLTYEVYFQYPLALALLFLAIGLFWPETRSPKPGAKYE